MTHTVISEEVAAQAVAVLVELLGAEDGPRQLVRERAASSLIRLFQTQSKHIGDDVAERARHPKASQAMRELSELTPEELLRVQHEMVSGRYPGKAS